MMFFHIKGKSSCHILASFGFGLTMFARIPDTVCHLRTAALFAGDIQLSFLSAYTGKPKASVCLGCSLQQLIVIQWSLRRGIHEVFCIKE